MKKIGGLDAGVGIGAYRCGVDHFPVRLFRAEGGKTFDANPDNGDLSAHNKLPS